MTTESKTSIKKRIKHFIAALLDTQGVFIREVPSIPIHFIGIREDKRNLRKDRLRFSSDFRKVIDGVKAEKHE